jgi:chromate reductase
MHIVGISGSLRKASTNTGLLRAIQQSLPAGHTMDIIVPGDLPLLNTDIEAPETLPATVTAFRQRVKRADGFIFASPENNYSVSAAFKNALDWASRGPDGNLFNDKPGACLSAGGGAGGLRAQQHLFDISVYLNLHMMNHPQIAVQVFAQPPRIDMTKTGEVLDPQLRTECETFVKSFLGWSDRINSTRAQKK